MQHVKCPSYRNLDNMLTNINWFQQPVGPVLNSFY